MEKTFIEGRTAWENEGAATKSSFVVRGEICLWVVREMPRAALEKKTQRDGEIGVVKQKATNSKRRHTY